jgi:uncharacterized membrane protein
VIYGIPFILKLVPPNKFFGFKMKSVLPDTDAWYFANRVFGVCCAAAGVLLGIVSLVLPSVAAEFTRQVRTLVILLFIVAPMIGVVLVTRSVTEKHVQD